MSLRPAIRLECPRCGYKLHYMCKNRDWPVDMWVPTSESRKHLTDATCKPPVIAEVVPIDLKLPRSQPHAA